MGDAPIVTVTNTTLSNNQALGGDDLNGGNDFGGCIFNSAGATLTVRESTITGNRAIGGGGNGGSDGLGVGGGLYLEVGGTVCIDLETIIVGNHASTSNDDVFGVFTPCP